MWHVYEETKLEDKRNKNGKAQKVIVFFKNKLFQTS